MHHLDVIAYDTCMTWQPFGGINRVGMRVRWPFSEALAVMANGSEWARFYEK